MFIYISVEWGFERIWNVWQWKREWRRWISQVYWKTGQLGQGTIREAQTSGERGERGDRKRTETSSRGGDNTPARGTSRQGTEAACRETFTAGVGEGPGLACKQTRGVPRPSGWAPPHKIRLLLKTRSVKS